MFEIQYIISQYYSYTKTIIFKSIVELDIMYFAPYWYDSPFVEKSSQDQSRFGLLNYSKTGFVPWTN